jgi:hypothetical protein
MRGHPPKRKVRSIMGDLIVYAPHRRFEDPKPAPPEEPTRPATPPEPTHPDTPTPTAIRTERLLQPTDTAGAAL